jgi:hypothetical protein
VGADRLGVSVSGRVFFGGVGGWGDPVNARWKKIARDLVAVMALKFNFVRDVETGGCGRS